MLKILFLDDNVSMTRLFKLLGEEHGFKAYVAGTIEQGLEIADREKPDVILVDIHLGQGPGDGWQFASALKTRKDLGAIPVIACSVTYNEEGRRYAMKNGIKFVNDKPYSLTKLNQILSGVIPPIPESASD